MWMLREGQTQVAGVSARQWGRGVGEVRALHFVWKNNRGERPTTQLPGHWPSRQVLVRRLKLKSTVPRPQGIR